MAGVDLAVLVRGESTDLGKLGLLYKMPLICTQQEVRIPLQCELAIQSHTGRSAFWVARGCLD